MHVHSLSENKHIMHAPGPHRAHTCSEHTTHSRTRGPPGRRLRGDQGPHLGWRASRITGSCCSTRSSAKAILAPGAARGPREGGYGLPPAPGSLTWAPWDLATQDPRPPRPTVFPGPTRLAGTQLRAAPWWGDYGGQWAQMGARESGRDGTHCLHLESRVCPGGRPAPASSARLCSAPR